MRLLAFQAFICYNFLKVNSRKAGFCGMEMVTISRTEYEQMKSLQAQVAALQQEVSWLTEQIRLARKQRSGSSSEKSPADDRAVQLSYLFNEPE